MGKRIVRCQAVILKDENILVLRQYNHKRQEEYWMLPGGGLEDGETEEECIRREIREETGLEINIIGILFDDAGNGIDEYKRYVTFLCAPIEGSMPRKGFETVSFREIMELVWCSVNNENQWNDYLLREQFYPAMKQLKNKLMCLGKI